MKVEVLQGFCVENGRDAFPGDLIELPDARARIKIAQGVVGPAAPAAPQAAGSAQNPQGGGLQTQAQAPTHRDHAGRR